MSLFEVGDRVRIKPFMRDFGTVTHVEEDHVTVVGASYNRGKEVRLPRTPAISLLRFWLPQYKHRRNNREQAQRLGPR